MGKLKYKVNAIYKLAKAEIWIIARLATDVQKIKF